MGNGAHTFFAPGPIRDCLSSTFQTLQGREMRLALVRLRFAQALAGTYNQQFCQELRSLLTYENDKGHLRKTSCSLLGTHQS